MWTPTNQSILVLSRPKIGGLARHVGVQLPDGRVAHCVPNDSVVVTSIEQYAAGENVTIIREVPYSRYWDVIERLTEAQSNRRPYDPISWNCEVFANWLIGEKPESSQITALAILALIAVIVKIAA